MLPPRAAYRLAARRASASAHCTPAARASCWRHTPPAKRLTRSLITDWAAILRYSPEPGGPYVGEVHVSEAAGCAPVSTLSAPSTARSAKAGQSTPHRRRVRRIVCSTALPLAVKETILLIWLNSFAAANAISFVLFSSRCPKNPYSSTQHAYMPGYAARQSPPPYLARRGHPLPFKEDG